MADAPKLALAVDFSATVFENVIVPLFLLARANVERGGGMVIEGRTFRGCLIEGPAVLLPLGAVDFDGCDFGAPNGDMTSLLLRPLSTERITGAVPMKGCSFSGCRFFSVGFTGAEAFLNDMSKVGRP